MKTLILSLGLTVLLLSFLNQTPKAWSDVASLPVKKPLQSDIIDFFSNGTQYQVNWSNFEQQAIQGINWIAIGFPNPSGSTGGVVNWTYPNAYVGG